MPGSTSLATHLAPAALAAVLAAGCAPSQPPPHVVFVLSDALRASSLGCYGYRQPTSPTIDALAREGVLFEQAIAVGGNTSTVVPALFTGHYPFFEYRDPWTAAPFGMDRFRRRPGGPGLPLAMTTLAERLSAAGYQTAAFFTNPYLKRQFAMNQGFDRYRFLHGDRNLPYRRAERVTRQVLDYLATVDWTRPSFLYVHFMDTHGPYRRPDPPFTEAAGAALSPDAHRQAWTSWGRLRQVRPADHAAELAYMTASYESGIRHVDDAVGAILGFYRDHSLAERTLFVFTADHGDEFLEHGATSHTGTLFEEIVHVPLIVRAPGGQRNARAPELVRNFDVTATLLDYAGLASTAAGLDARSLRPLLQGRRGAGAATVFASFPWIRMLRTERYKLLRDADGGESLYDLATDPRESSNLAASQDAEVRRTHAALARRLDRMVERLRAEGEGAALPAAPAPLDEATRSELRALGYLD